MSANDDLAWLRGRLESAVLARPRDKLGSRAATGPNQCGGAVQAVGRRDAGGWKIVLLQGGLELAAFRPAQFRALAASGLELAELIEGAR